MMELCKCGHERYNHGRPMPGELWVEGACGICGCPEFIKRHDSRYDPDDAARKFCPPCRFNCDHPCEEYMQHSQEVDD